MICKLKKWSKSDPEINICFYQTEQWFSRKYRVKGGEKKKVIYKYILISHKNDNLFTFLLTFFENIVQFSTKLITFSQINYL